MPIAVIIGVTVFGALASSSNPPMINPSNYFSDTCASSFLQGSLVAVTHMKREQLIRRSQSTLPFTAAFGVSHKPHTVLFLPHVVPLLPTSLRKLSQLTPRLRLYSGDCNVTSLALDAIED